MNSIKRLINYSNLLKNSYFVKRNGFIRKLSLISSLPSTKPLLSRAQKLVIDLSFDDKMSSEECQRLARELYAIYCLNNSFNKKEMPFDISLCNQLSDNSLTVEYLRQYLPQINTTNDNLWHNFRIFNKSYLELFDRKRLVYLTPDTEELISYDLNDIYIIGGIVDKYCFKTNYKPKHLTHSKAIGEGIRVGRFPIDHLISDKMNKKVILFLPQVFGILSVVKETQNWEIAVRKHLPFWKLKDEKQVIANKVYYLK
jgi:hypothetical protein